MRPAPFRQRTESRSGRVAGRPDRARGDREGQSLVEFALVLSPLLLVLLAIIQFGFIFNTYVTMTNATREATRTGTIYIYDRTLSKDQNDLARNNSIKTSVLASMNMLVKSAPQFATGLTWSQSSATYTNGDLTISYVIPTGVIDTDPRTGQQVTITAYYHQDLIVPIVANLLPRDSGGRLKLSSQVTMVIN